MGPSRTGFSDDADRCVQRWIRRPRSRANAHAIAADGLAGVAIVAGSARVVVTLGLVLSAVMTTAPAVEPMTGRALFDHCTDAARRPHSSAVCATYFRGVLDALRSAKRPAASTSHCVPDSIQIEELVTLYVSESRRFPHVLDVPAATLIAGMLVKFFACQAARSERHSIHESAQPEYAQAT